MTFGIRSSSKINEELERVPNQLLAYTVDVFSTSLIRSMTLWSILIFVPFYKSSEFMAVGGNQMDDGSSHCNSFNDYFTSQGNSINNSILC